LLRQLRQLNPAAVIIVHSELLEQVPGLYAAGASYVSVPRLLEAATLLEALEAAEQGLLSQKSRAQQELAGERKEVIP